jgi:hypothetical protein
MSETLPETALFVGAAQITGFKALLLLLYQFDGRAFQDSHVFIFVADVGPCFYHSLLIYSVALMYVIITSRELIDDQ